VCSWFGNSEAISWKHYLQVTEADFAKALQKAVQQPAIIGSIVPQSVLDDVAKQRQMQDRATHCGSLQSPRAVGLGFEPREPGGSPVFKTGAFDHSATRPKERTQPAES
jgi:hypothetical protein